MASVDSTNFSFGYSGGGLIRFPSLQLRNCHFTRLFWAARKTVLYSGEHPFADNSATSFMALMDVASVALCRINDDFILVCISSYRHVSGGTGMDAFSVNPHCILLLGAYRRMAQFKIGFLRPC